MAEDTRTGKQKDWETGYIDRVKYLHDIREAQDVYQSYEYNSSDEGPSSTLGTIGGNTFELTKTIISANEGTYTSVQGSDNKHGVSLGKFQWHEGRAKALLLSMQALDSNIFNSTLNNNGGSSILTKLTKSSWDELTFNSQEVDAVKKVLEIDKFKVIQDNLADKDLQNYINKATDSGLTDSKAIAYFADLYNQSPKRALDITEVALRSGGGLSAMHKAALANPIMGQYATRRNNTYDKLVNAKIASKSSSGNVSIGDIPIASIKNGLVSPPICHRGGNQKDLYNLIQTMSVDQFASLDTDKFSFPNGQHSNMFFPHFAQIMYLVHQKVVPLLGTDKLIISSGIRTGILDVEKKMNVTTISPHMAGIAIDIFIAGGGQKRFTVADTAWSLGLRAIGVGKDHVHIDAGPTAHWKEHDETKVYRGPGRWEKP